MTKCSPEQYRDVQPRPVGRLPRTRWQARQFALRECKEHDGDSLSAKGCPALPYDAIELYLPILASGFGHVDTRDSLLAALSAVGDFVAECRRRGHLLPPMRVTFCLDEAEEVLASDIQSGRVDLSGVMARSMDGWIEFHAVSEETGEGAAAGGRGRGQAASGGKAGHVGGSEFVSRAVRVPLRSSRVADMREVMGLRRVPLPAGVSEHSLLGDLGVTEGCMVTFTDADVVGDRRGDAGEMEGAHRGAGGK